MATAVDWQYLARNPVEGVKLPPVIANLEEPYRTMAVVASATGMRESEVLALKWEDFDTEAQIISGEALALSRKTQCSKKSRKRARHSLRRSGPGRSRALGKE